MDLGRDPTLFGNRRGLERRDQRRLAAVRGELAATRRERRNLAADASAPGFAIEAAFAPELRQGGFDLVVGNPPWVRAERLSAVDRHALQARFRWWRGTGRQWHHLPDLSVAFVERAMGLLGSSGTIAFLLPAKLATAGYARSLREAMVREATLHVVANLGDDPRADFQATTYPLAVLASRRHPTPEARVRTSLSPSGASACQADWARAETWGGGLRDAWSRHPRLAERFSPALGVKTGANAAFLDPPRELVAWTRPVVRGRDLRGVAACSTHRILWPADAAGHAWAMLPPALARHLAPHRRRLEARTDLQGGPWWRLFRTAAATARWRVIWADIAPTLRAFVLEDAEAVPLNSCYVIAVRDRDAAHRLAAWLSTTPIGDLARAHAEPASGGFWRFGARAVGSVPLPAAVLGGAHWGSLANMPPGEERRRALDAQATSMLAGSSMAAAGDAVIANRR